jgi:hypothetical protein
LKPVAAPNPLPNWEMMQIKGRRVVPGRLSQSGFKFCCPDFGLVVADLLS